jgi:hypothetical protein
MTENLELFQDMTILAPAARRQELRAALVAAATPPWAADLSGSAEIMRNSAPSGDVVVFRHEAGTDYPAARLTLWETADGYKVSNVVPEAYGQLTISQYNAILNAFIAEVAAPTTETLGLAVKTTKAHQSIDDLLSPDAASKLKRFSGAANKSTGASHPLDEKRWFDFIIAVHHADENMGADLLARWLHEVGGWDEESAHNLASDFEKALGLLAQYDKK